MHDNFLWVIFSLISGWLITSAILPGIMSMIGKSGFLKANYLGELIPSGLGVVLYLSVLGVLSLSLPFLPKPLHFKIVAFLFTLTGFTLLGLMDDLWGSGECRGLSGHVKSLIRGEMTTGSIKAVAGGVIALVMSAILDQWILIPLNALMIALSVNMINLMDLRPGRAGKAFLFLALLMVAAFPDREENFFMMAVAGSLLAYLPIDLKARAMMGDAGANALGSVLGLAAVWLLSLEMKGFYVVLLILLHLLSEKYSLTQIISDNRVLNYLDRWGRK